MTVLAGQTALWLAFGLAVVVPFTIAVSVGVAALFVAFDGSAGNIGEVQRFIELTDEARGLVPPGLPLLDSDKGAATTAAIVDFQAKKDEARRALRASRNGHRAGREVSLSASPVRLS
ncbi:MAG TPA: hypothetical protein VHI55_12305 [Gaiellaceae bacterium]|jgi:hypothetical protein|nr:hypothetical protein [Gaiellaceae bacterium]